MRFQSLSLIAALTAATTADATKSLNADELNQMIRSGKIDTKALLKSAIPYKQHLDRNLEDNGGQSYNGYLHGLEITGDKSIEFNSCVTLSVQQEVDENVFAYAENAFLDGSIRSVKSYVLFNVCTTDEDCSNLQDDVDNTYLVDLVTWISALVTYLPDKKDEFCTGCQYQYSYCSSQASYAAAEVDFDLAYFTYNDVRYQLIDCEQCFNFGCFDHNGDAYDQNDWEGVSEWMEGISACYQTGSYWQNLDLYAGWMCNGDGDGMEIAVFVDDECTLYNSQKSFGRIIGNNNEYDWEYYSKSTDIVNYIFNNRFNCYGGDITYINLFQEVYLEEGDYDPCQVDETTGNVLDYDECQEMLYEIPCYSGYDDYQYGYNAVDGENGDGNRRLSRRHRYSRWLENQNNNGDQDEECAEFLEEYPCWTMPGEEVAEEYQEACYEYQLAYKPQAMDACTALFGGNDDQDGAEATALSDCSYYDGQQQQNNADDDANGENNGQWDAYVTYDIYQNDAYNQASICNYIESIYSGDVSTVVEGYDHDSSGTLYGDTTTGGGSYFPTINPNSLRKPKKLGTVGIIVVSLSVIIVTFLLALAINRLRKAYRRQQIAEMKDTESKDVPFLD